MIATSLTAPKFVVWMELLDQHIVGHAVVMPEDTEGAVARTLRRALTQPVAGSPRRPDVIRVADATIAAEVRDEVAGTIPVKVAPTPELDELLKHMQAAMPEVEGGEASYFAGSHVSPAAVEKLFTAAFPCSRSSRGRLPTTRRCYGWTSRRSTSTAPASRSSANSTRAAAC